MPRDHRLDRDYQMAQAVLIDGLTYDAAGERFDVSYERVRQVVARYVQQKLRIPDQQFVLGLRVWRTWARGTCSRNGELVVPEG
jgi:hypothetical protein